MSKALVGSFSATPRSTAFESWRFLIIVGVMNCCNVWYMSFSKYLRFLLIAWCSLSKACKFFNTWLKMTYWLVLITLLLLIIAACYTFISFTKHMKSSTVSWSLRKYFGGPYKTCYTRWNVVGRMRRVINRWAIVICYCYCVVRWAVAGRMR